MGGDPRSTSYGAAEAPLAAAGGPASATSRVLEALQAALACFPFVRGILFLLLSENIPPTCAGHLDAMFVVLGVCSLLAGGLAVWYFRDGITQTTGASVAVPRFAYGCAVAVDCCWICGIVIVSDKTRLLCGTANVDAFWVLLVLSILGHCCVPLLHKRRIAADGGQADTEAQMASGARSPADLLAGFGAAVLTLVAVTLVLSTRAAVGRGYSEARATDFAQLAGAAYCQAAALKDWACGEKCLPGVASVELCHGATTQAFAGRLGDGCVASFQGTRDTVAWLTNLRFIKADVPWEDCNQCRVHSGFLAEWQSLEPCIEAQLAAIGCPRGARLALTGHSLGGAVATLAAMSLEVRGWHVEEVYTFGAPRIGDDNFAHAFTHRFRGRFFRVTHGQDPIPHLPPMPWRIVNMHYAHMEPEIFYEGRVDQGFAVCKVDGDHRCASKHANLLGNILLHVDDHRDYMGVDTGGDGCEHAADLAQIVARLAAPGAGAGGGALRRWQAT